MVGFNEVQRSVYEPSEICFIYILSLQFIKLNNKSERTKERIKVSIYGEAQDFDNIDNPLSFLL